MELLPSIDLLEERVVRLVKGRLDDLIDYGREPLEVAKELEGAGVDGIHIVDLGAALGLEPSTELVIKIANEVSIPVQVGGGIRSYDGAKGLLESGVERVVVGTLAFKDEKALERLLDEFGPKRIVVAVDYKNWRVVVRGWRNYSGLELFDAVDRLKGLGTTRFLATNVERDGTMLGPDFGTLSKLSKLCYVYASGGVRGIEDLLKLKPLGVKGAIVGRAYYEGLIDLKLAVRELRYASQEDNTLP